MKQMTEISYIWTLNSSITFLYSFFCIKKYVYRRAILVERLFIYLFTQPLLHEKDAIQGQFLREYSWFKFTVFLLVDSLPNQI